jgi:ketosteroid isomerase-like protein
MIEIDWARAFAEDWIAAWNAGDLEQIFTHYADDFEMTSSLIVQRMGEADGVLKGKAAIRPYWSHGLATRPPLRFELLDVVVGVNSLALYYRSAARSSIVVEYFAFNAERQVIRSEALRRPD